MPYKQFINNTTLTAEDVNDFLAEQAVLVFANATERNNQLPAPQEGMVCYLKTTKRFYGFDGTSWLEITHSPAAVKVHATASQNIPTSSWTAVTFGAVAVGDAGMFTNGSRLVAPVAGMYEVKALVSYPVNANGHRFVGYRFNGSDPIIDGMAGTGNGSSGSRVNFIVNDTVYLNANQYIEIMTYQNSTVTLASTYTVSSATEVRNWASLTQVR